MRREWHFNEQIFGSNNNSNKSFFRVKSNVNVYEINVTVKTHSEIISLLAERIAFCRFPLLLLLMRINFSLRASLINTVLVLKARNVRWLLHRSFRHSLKNVKARKIFYLICNNIAARTAAWPYIFISRYINRITIAHRTRAIKENTWKQKHRTSYLFSLNSHMTDSHAVIWWWRGDHSRDGDAVLVLRRCVFLDRPGTDERDNKTDVSLRGKEQFGEQRKNCENALGFLGDVARRAGDFRGKGLLSRFPVTRPRASPQRRN